MSTAAVLALVVLLSSPPADTQSEQTKMLKSCPVLTNAEAAEALGPGTVFASGVEATSGTARISLLCEFVQDERTLTVLAGKTSVTRASGRRCANCRTAHWNLV